MAGCRGHLAIAPLGSRRIRTAGCQWGMAAHAGWLTKKGGIRKNWLRRWFELGADGELVYYVSEDKQKRKGSIELWQSSDIRDSTAPGAATTEIEIVTPERTWRVQTDTVAELAVWLQTLRHSAEAARSGRGRGARAGRWGWPRPRAEGERLGSSDERWEQLDYSGE
jgi:hypothetical protein